MLLDRFQIRALAENTVVSTCKRVSRSTWILIDVALGLTMVPGDRLIADDARPLLGPATSAEIATRIMELADSAYETRTFATRRLCAIGAAARPQLTEAAKGPDFEAALRARNLLSLLDQILLSGVEISLEFSETNVPWDRPVTLVVTLHNRSPVPARLPFFDSIDDRSSTPVPTSESAQVGRMLDLADYLLVKGPSGVEVDLRMDDISAEPDVASAVHVRLNAGGGVMLDAGKTATVRLAAFNRGWARYPTLDEGDYSVVVDYIPNWDDEVLNQHRVGRVTSNTARLRVNRSAPKTVSRSGQPGLVELERHGGDLIARWVNTSDQPVILNLNFGRTAPFATVKWVFEKDAEHVEARAADVEGEVWWDFHAERLKQIDSGESLEIARISVFELQRKFREAGANVGGDRWKVHFSYSNPCDRGWQSRQGASLLGNANVPTVLRLPLPRLLLATRQNSNELAAPENP